MKKVILAVVIFAAGTAIGYGAGRWSSASDAKELILARELGTISLCANGLNALDDSKASKTALVLDHQLRAAVDSATKYSGASANFDFPTPSLVDGLRRAKAYAERRSDKQLAEQIAQLQASIKQPAS